MTPLGAGDRAPDFDLTDGDGNRWRLADLRGRKVVLYFYPADHTRGCTTQACDFRDSQTDFGARGYIVLGVSPQGAASHRSFAREHGLGFPLLVDEGLRAARAYGAVRARPAEHDGVPLKVRRCTFVIDEEGGIEQALYDVTARGHVDGLRELLGV